MTHLRNSGLSIVPILGIASVAWFIAACATGHRIERVPYQSCEGKTVTAFVRVEESNAPALDCAKAWSERGYSAPAVAFTMATLPLGCAVRYPDNSEGPVWLVITPAGPLAGPVWEHERGHIEGFRHPPGFMFHTHREC